MGVGGGGGDERARCGEGVVGRIARGLLTKITQFLYN